MNEQDFGKGKESAVLMDRIERKLAAYKDKKSIEITSRDVLTTTKITADQKGYVKPRAYYTEHYEKLLTGKVIGEGMKKRCKDYADIMMQETTYCELELQTRKTTIATINIFCTLPEHIQDFANYWINKTIDSQTFQQMVKDFETTMQSRHNIGQCIIKTTPKQTVTITSCEATLTFA